MNCSLLVGLPGLDCRFVVRARSAITEIARRNGHRLCVSVVSGLVLGVIAPPALSAAVAPTTLTRVGLYDASHTGPDGLHVSSLFYVDESRWMTGISVNFARTNIDTEDWTYTGWVMDPQGVIRTVGFTDALHTRADGFRRTRPDRVNEQGVAAGTSVRFDGMNDAGQSAWIQDRWGNIVKVGFYDAAHTATEGGIYKYSALLGLNNRNQAMGYSLNRDTEQTTAWIVDSVGRIQRLGFFDAAHTAPDGTSWSMPAAINNAGHVIGQSEHTVAEAPTESGATAWIRQPWGTMRRIGFETGIHRSPTGQHASVPSLLTESGYVAGFSLRYRSTPPVRRMGQTAWVTHADGPNRPVGFYTGVHLSSGLVASSTVTRLNERGYSAGVSLQYPAGVFDAAASIGATAWMAMPQGSTVRVGLYDAEHTAAGAQHNNILDLNEVDAAVGSARRFGSGGVDLGWSGWVANIRGQTTRLSLEDARHTRADGYRETMPLFVNDTGAVAGWSARFAGMERRGETAWVYDRSTRTYVRFELSARADGRARSWITHLHDDGSVVGGFIPYAANGSELPEEIFVYTPAQGVVRLSERFRFGMDAFGWDLMGSASYSFGADHLVGPAAGFDPVTGNSREQAVYWLH